ncbi:efflux RND transporter periplasmic adaptor subunit [Fusibacter ferrireducens]|uniref:RND efflux pump membrane fusion protein barrel-sandwich domain-containing protein n=1 Tax=Fusibacter ferrireducens TaxID=2785058 RepID=A0ABR9ZN96_9FIRM|nr:efflux RND transporter periplasmic adaptor subunit [Fusibacter ferrireducens]MBF4691904.1 hypothetical protein [Fusibacter ferrireducens]
MQNSYDVKKRSPFKRIGGILIIALVILTFVSKTIYNYNLPVVTGTLPLNGTLNKIETVREVTEWAKEIKIYTSDDGHVDEVFIKKGDYVLKDQPLVKLSETESRMLARKKNANELKQIDWEINNAELDLSKSKVLYDAGIIAQAEFEKQTRDIEALYAQKETLILDSKNLQKSGAMTLYAPNNMLVLDVPIHEGQELARDECVATCGLSGNFILNCLVSPDNDFIIEGDTCKVKNLSHTFEGVVTEVRPEKNKKKVIVRIQSNDVKFGETFEVEFEKKGVETHILVPNGLVQKDSNGYFLYQIKQREGMFGNEFYIQKLHVYIGDNDHEYTIITKGITFFEPFVLLSNKPLKEGGTVILENEGDFFAK